MTRIAAVAGTAFVALAGFFGYSSYKLAEYENSQPVDVTAKVVNTDMIVDDGRNIHLVHTDKGTFMNVDDRIKGKFNQATVLQAQIQKDSTYTFNVYGYESKRANIYPNILSAVPAKQVK